MNSAELAIVTLAVNVCNKKLSDFEFRAFVANIILDRTEVKAWEEKSKAGVKSYTPIKYDYKPSGGKENENR